MQRTHQQCQPCCRGPRSGPVTEQRGGGAGGGGEFRTSQQGAIVSLDASNSAGGLHPLPLPCTAFALQLPAPLQPACPATAHLPCYSPPALLQPVIPATARHPCYSPSALLQPACPATARQPCYSQRVAHTHMPRGGPGGPEASHHTACPAGWKTHHHRRRRQVWPQRL